MGGAGPDRTDNCSHFAAGLGLSPADADAIFYVFGRATTDSECIDYLKKDIRPGLAATPVELAERIRVIIERKKGEL